MKIYTKVGDGGNTFLLDGVRVRKNHPRVKAYGDVDELNGVLGLAAALGADAPLKAFLLDIQRELFVLGADLSAPRRGGHAPESVPRITAAHIVRLEREIDRISDALPPLRHFILPGGAPAGAALHVARTVARRAERSLTPLLQSDPTLREAQIYLNRLSDYLFVLARWVNRRARRAEREWKPSPIE
jgi:cob(I)alamin adenosyltransferase